jgi:hypothetical protein
MRYGKVEDGALIFRRAHETVDKVDGAAAIAAE